MATYTAKGTASAKASGTTLATSSLSFTAGDMQLVCLAYDDAAGHPTSVSYGNRLLANRPPAATRNPGTFDIAMSLWVVPKIKLSGSRVITATWSSAIVEKAMAVGAVDGKNRINQASGNNDATATGNPTTGITGDLITAGSFVTGTEYEIVTVGTTDFTAIGASANTVGVIFTATGVGSGTGTARSTLVNTDDFAVAIFAAEGPDTNDTPGTMQILDGGTWTNVTGTQRIGTNGAPPVSNVTINVGWLQLTSQSPTQGRITGATSRSWTSCIVTLKAGNEQRVGVSPSDLADIEEIFENETPALDPENAAFVYDPQTVDHFEVYEKNDMATRIAYYDGGKWVTG